MRPDGFVPKERYTTRDFAELELDAAVAARLADRVPGGSRSPAPATSSSTRSATSPIVVVRGRRPARCTRSTTRACTGAAGSPTAAARSPTARSGAAYHGWCYALDGRLVDVPDREEFAGLPDDLALATGAASTRWGGFVFVNLDPDAEPLLDFLDPLPDAARPVPPRPDAPPRVR